MLHEHLYKPPAAASQETSFPHGSKEKLMGRVAGWGRAEEKRMGKDISNNCVVTTPFLNR